MLVSVAANAGITLSGLATETLPVKNNTSYRVSVYASKIGNQFAFRVYNTSANWINGQKPTHDADTLRVTFFTGAYSNSAHNCTGAIVGGITVNGSASTFATKVGGTGGNWNTAGGTHAMFTNAGVGLTAREVREINRTNNNMFAESASGRIMVALTAKCFSVQLTNFSGEPNDIPFTTYDALFFNVPNLTGVPEGGSAALMLPGLLTVGFALWRRRAIRSSDKTA